MQRFTRSSTRSINRCCHTTPHHAQAAPARIKTTQRRGSRLAMSSSIAAPPQSRSAPFSYPPGPRTLLPSLIPYPISPHPPSSSSIPPILVWTSRRCRDPNGMGERKGLPLDKSKQASNPRGRNDNVLSIFGSGANESSRAAQLRAVPALFP